MVKLALISRRTHLIAEFLGRMFRRKFLFIAVSLANHLFEHIKKIAQLGKSETFTVRDVYIICLSKTLF